MREMLLFFVSTSFVCSFSFSFLLFVGDDGELEAQNS